MRVTGGQTVRHKIRDGEPPYLVECCPRLLFPDLAGRALANLLERGFSFERSDTVSSNNTTGRPFAAPYQIRALSHHDNPVRHTRRSLRSPNRWHYDKPCHLSGTRGPYSYGKVSGPLFFFLRASPGYMAGKMEV